MSKGQSLNSGDCYSYVRNNAAAVVPFFHYRMHSLTCTTQQPMEQGCYTTEAPGVACEN